MLCCSYSKKRFFLIKHNVFKFLEIYVVIRKFKYAVSNLSNHDLLSFSLVNNMSVGHDLCLVLSRF